MGGVLKGWRRKIGVLTLFAGLVFAGGWVKSSTDRSVACVPNGNITDELPMSGRICVEWSSVHIENNQEVPGFQMQFAGLYDDFSLPPSHETECDSQRSLELQTDVPGVTADFNFDVSRLSDLARSKLQQQVIHVDESAGPGPMPAGLTTAKWQGAGFYANRRSTADGHWTTTLFIPYWAIVIPFALLGAALFIRPPSAKRPMQSRVGQPVPAPSVG